MNLFREFFLEFFLPFLCIIAGAMGLVCGALYVGDRIDCPGFAEGTGLQTRYQGLDCYVKLGDAWVPKKYVFGDAHELRIQKR